MMGTQGMASDWRERHPFKIGDCVSPRLGTGSWSPGGIDLRVTMRGEDDFGCWIVINDGGQRLDAKLFEAVPSITAEVA